MAIAAVMVDEVTQNQLGQDGLDQLCASLWAEECQTCGRALGEEPPAVVVTEYPWEAFAVLHHTSCRTPEWNDTGFIVGGAGAHLTWRARAFITAIQAGRDQDKLCALVVNPSLEQVMLTRPEAGDADDPSARSSESGGRQGWQVTPAQDLLHAGLLPPGQVVIGRPIEGAVARLGDEVIGVTIGEPMPQTWAGRTDVPGMRQHITDRGGLMLVVTHAVNPDDIATAAQLGAVMSDPRTVLGWVELAERRAARPPARPVTSTEKSGTTYVLNWAGTHLSVGELLAHNPKELSGTKAKAWAEKTITEHDRRAWLIGWDSIPDGYATTDALSAASYLVRRYPDGWRLVKALSRADAAIAPLAQTETEARNWANRVLEVRTLVRNPDWRPGPTPDGAITLYAST